MDTRRTTINLPENLFEAAKAAAFYRKTTLSDLIREGLANIVYGKDLPSKKKGYSSFVGGRSLGIKKIRREDIYESNLREKVSG